MLSCKHESQVSNFRYTVKAVGHWTVWRKADISRQSKKLRTDGFSKHLSNQMSVGMGVWYCSCVQIGCWKFGVSLSEPHTDELDVRNCMYVYVCMYFCI